MCSVNGGLCNRCIENKPTNSTQMSVSKMNPKQKLQPGDVVTYVIMIAAVSTILGVGYYVYDLAIVQVDAVVTQRFDELKDEYPNVSCEQIIEHVEDAGHKYSLLHSRLTKLNWSGWLRYAEYKGC